MSRGFYRGDRERQLQDALRDAGYEIIRDGASPEKGKEEADAPSAPVTPPTQEKSDDRK